MIFVLVNSVASLVRDFSGYAPNKFFKRRSDSINPCSVKVTLFAWPRGSEMYPCSCRRAMDSQSNALNLNSEA